MNGRYALWTSVKQEYLYPDKKKAIKKSFVFTSTYSSLFMAFLSSDPRYQRTNEHGSRKERKKVIITRIESNI